MYPYQHDAERRMTALANKFAAQGLASKAQGLEGDGHEALDVEMRTRILNQLARELLLAQSSDWAFQIYQGTTVEYSSRRFRSHIHRFDLLAKMLETGEVNEKLFDEIESRDNIFAEIDYKVYCTRD